jgi:hypothetical protein
VILFISFSFYLSKNLTHLFPTKIYHPKKLFLTKKMKFSLFSIFLVAALLIGQMAPERIDPPANCKDGFLCGVTLQCACDQYCRMHQDETVLNGSCLDLTRGNGTRHKPEMKGMGGGAFALLTALCRIFTKGRCGE